ncbi:MAG TPA: ROK family protein [Tepidisphaeraceae bacterium]|nr:ROK family protein [Tepidisphaeraceae bacterium]
MTATDGLATGLDVGVTNVKAAVVTADGGVVAREQFETRSESPDWPARVAAGLADLERRFGSATAVGLAAPGVARADGRCIRWMRGRLAEVEGLDWSERLGRPVPVINDAQAALLGEIWLGAAKGASNAILLTLGTGVGGAAVVDGRLLRGWLGRAGHFGHICLDVDGEQDIVRTPGSLETMIGNYNIAGRSGGRFDTTHSLIAALRAGDEPAQTVWAKSVRALACGIASLVNVLDPEVVIVGGGIAAAGATLFEPLAAELKEVLWRLDDEHVRVVPAALGEFAGAFGAARNAMVASADYPTRIHAGGGA